MLNEESPGDGLNIRNIADKCTSLYPSCLRLEIGLLLLLLLLLCLLLLLGIVLFGAALVHEHQSCGRINATAAAAIASHANARLVDASDSTSSTAAAAAAASTDRAVARVLRAARLATAENLLRAQSGTHIVELITLQYVVLSPPPPLTF